MKILRVAQNLYPQVPGGGSYHVHAMSRDQAAMGHDVTVLTVSSDPSLPRHERRDGYHVVRCRPTVELLKNEISVGVGRHLLDRDDIDVVHAHSHLYFSTNLAAAISRLSDVPLVVTNHGLISQTAPGWVQRLFLPTVGRFTFNAADRILCYTDADRSRLEDRKSVV